MKDKKIKEIEKQIAQLDAIEDSEKIQKLYRNMFYLKNK